MSVRPAVMRRLMRELTELKTSPPEGIRVVTSDDNMLDITGIIQGPEGTPYAGGYFKVRFSFTEEFPAAPPKCWFATKIFHPNVSTAGEICVNTLKKDWQASYGISHILVTVKCLLIYPNPESALDEEAGKLLLENYESYCERARLITSVHATPRVPPPEFDTPASTSSSEASTSASTSALSSASSAPSKSPSQPTILPTTASSTFISLPLSPSPSATTLTLPDSSKAKDRHVSPSPLGPADSNSNVRSGHGTGLNAGTMTAKDKDKSGINVGGGGDGANKAVKRSAGSAGSGAEKRKKALKRL